MTLLRTIAFFAISMAMLNYANAAPLSDATLNKLLEVSGAINVVKADTDSLNAVLEQSKAKGLQSASAEKVVSALSKENLLLDGVKSTLKADLKEEEANKLISWFESDLGKKIVKSEIDAASPEGLENLRNLGKSLFEDQDRVKLSTQLLIDSQKLTNATLIQSKFIHTITVIDALNEFPDDKVKTQTLERIANNTIKEESQTIVRQLQMLTLYSFKDFSDAEIKEYIDILQWNEMKTLKHGVAKGSVAALQTVIGPELSK